MADTRQAFNLSGSRRFKPVACAALICLCALAPPLVMAQQEIQTLRALNQSGRSAEALALADQLLFLYEGDPAFDLEYGIAAVDAGLISEGIFALERVTMNQPNNLFARLELGRAYFASGEDDRARAEFNRVLETNPPAEVRDNVRPYLDAITAREGQRRPVWRGSIDLSSGYDSNINASTDDDLSTLLGLPPGSVTAATPKEDSFASLSGSLSYTQPLSTASDYGITASINHRENASGDLPQTFGGLNASYNHRGEVRTWNLGVMANQLRLEDADYRSMLGLNASLRVTLAPGSSLTFAAQGSQLNYPDNPANDAFLTMGSVSFQQALGGRYRPLLTAGVSLGKEDAEDKSAPGALQNTQRDILGANLDLGFSLNSNLQLGLGLRYQRSEFAEPLVLPPVLRVDKNLNASVLLNWRVADDWFVGFRASATDNSSSAVFTDYQREQISVNLRYLFR